MHISWSHPGPFSIYDVSPQHYGLHYGRDDMTLITALRGSDGIVLASDRRVVENWPSLNTGQEGTASVQITHYGSKVICGGKHDLVVGCAGDYEAQRVGREVIQALEMQSATPDDIMETLRDVAENWYK